MDYIRINGTEYPLKFGLGFLRTMDKRVTVPVESFGGKETEAGFRWAVMNLIDNNIDTLLDVLLVANRGQNLQLTMPMLEEWVEDENTDIEATFDMVLDFLKQANVTKKVTTSMMESVAEALEQQKAK